MVREIQLRADGFTSEQLYAESEKQWEMLDQLERLVDKVAAWFTESTDPDEKTRLWEQYTGLCRDFTVLTSWYNITYSAYTFSLAGSELTHVSLGDLQTAHAFFADDEG